MSKTNTETTMATTSKNISEDQIKALMVEATKAGDVRMVGICCCALGRALPIALWTLEQEADVRAALVAAGIDYDAQFAEGCLFPAIAECARIIAAAEAQS